MGSNVQQTSTQTTTPQGTSSASNAGQGNGQGNDAADRSRLYIALAIVLGLIVVLIIVVLQNQVSESQQLAGIFSGWVTSIVAFYFYGQSNAQAQKQINSSAQTAAASDQRAATAEKKLSSVRSMATAHAAHVTRAAQTPADQVIADIGKIIDAP